jgi:hypothetical protein
MISSTQQIDYLWKKLGFGLAKTDVPASKTAFNESIISPPFMPGNEIWAEADLIPSVIPVSSTTKVEVHTGTNCVQCVADITATTNRTWLSGLTDWVPILYGSTYQIKIYLDLTSATDPTVTGTQLFAAGATPTSNDEWFFDYQAGVLHFIGTNLPSGSFAGKAIYVSGARYIGIKGLHISSSGTFGNLSFAGDTISSTNTIILDPTTANISVSNAVISNVGYSTDPNAAATVQYVTNQLSLVQANSNIIQQGNSYVYVSDNPAESTGNVTTVIDGNVVSTYSAGSFTLNGVTLSSSSTTNLIFEPSQYNLTVIDSTTAMQLPTGTTGQRPSNPYAGLTRFNSDTNVLEYFDGVKWVSLRYNIDSQVIFGDGVTQTFPLAHDATQISILVNINGAVQQPDAYFVNGNFITFPLGDVPLPTDIVEIRFLNLAPATGVSLIQQISLTNDNGIVVDTTTVNISSLIPTVIDTFDTALYDCAKYIIKAKDTTNNEFQLTEVLVWYINSVIQYSVSSSVFSGVDEFVTFNAQLNSGNIEFLALGASNSIYLKVYKTLFTI